MSKPKTLLVEFAPRQEKSLTKSLRVYFTDLIANYTKLTEVNLCKDTPPLHTGKSIQAYYKRNYQGETLTQVEQSLLQPFDELREQLMEHDVLIISTPMYNFGMPAPVKAWIDAVMQKEHVYTTDQEKGHIPQLGHLKVIILYTSGILYDQIQENEDWNGVVAEGPKLFEYMGAQIVRVVHVQGVDMLPEKNVKFRIENVAKRKLNTLAKNWYKVKEDLVTYSL